MYFFSFFEIWVCMIVGKASCRSHGNQYLFCTFACLALCLYEIIVLSVSNQRKLLY